MTLRTLYYVGDPMCSWCFAFQPAIDAVRALKLENFTLRYVMGGLAPDSDEPMPEETQRYVQDNWRAIEEQTPARFNWDFWTNCSPRRSTYPACRAVIAAGLQNEAFVPAVFEAIQMAYYAQARNPSDVDTLVQAARDALPDLDAERFARDLESDEVEALLQQDFELRRRIRGGGFPTLILESGGNVTPVQEGWAPPETVVRNLEALLESV